MRVNINFDYQRAVKEIGKGIYGTFLGPYVEESVKRINYHAFDSIDKICQEVEESIGAKAVRILDIDRASFIFGKPSFKESFTVPELMNFIDDYTLELDLPLDAIDVHPTTYSYGAKGFTLVGQSHYYNGPIIEEAIKVYVLPTLKK